MTKEQGDLAVKILAEHAGDTEKCTAQEFHKIQDVIHTIMIETGAEWPFKDEGGDAGGDQVL